MSEEAIGSKYKTVEWEEAGGEFYQESYWDWDGATPKDNTDTSAIRTILPSKQNRCGTTRRQSGVPELKYAKYWQQSTAQKTKCNDVQFAKLPDLSEVHTNEENIWEEILQIKLLPISMLQKKMLKANLNSATKLRLQGLNQFKWKQRKFCQQWQIKWSELLRKMELWRSSLKAIEGHFGSGVMAYFLLLRWLFFLNCFTFVLMLLFIVLPNFYNLQQQGQDVEHTSSRSTNESMPSDAFHTLAHLLEWQPLVYESYLPAVLANHSNEMTTSTATNHDSLLLVYNLPVAYVCVNVAYLGLCLLLLLRATVREFKQRLTNGKWELCQYCNVIFCGWDYCTHSAKFVGMKHTATYAEIKRILQSKQLQRRRKTSRNYQLKKRLTRALVNVAVCVILILAGGCTYLLFNISFNYQTMMTPNVTATATLPTRASSSLHLADNRTWDEEEEMEETTHSNTAASDSDVIAPPSTGANAQMLLFFEFLPSMTIVCINFVAPVAFHYLGKFEQCSVYATAQLALARNVLLRLTTLAVLLSCFYRTVVIPQQRMAHGCGWETYVGQQFYRLAITELFMHLLVTFGLNWVHAMCARRCNKNGGFLAAQQFEIPQHVVDIVQLQATSWLACLYCPLLPALVALILFVMFYVKKFQCLINSTLSGNFYAPSRANAIFLVVLVAGYALTLPAIAFAFTLQPSRSCGPFSGQASVSAFLALAFARLPDVVKSGVLFFATANFIVPSVCLLLAFLYYFYAVAGARRQEVTVLRNQLVLEGHDKQFLLNRLSVFIKQFEKNEI